MDNIDLGSLNYVAIIVAVIINQVVGAAWYRGFGSPWMAEVGITEESLEGMKGTSRQWYPYVVAVVAALIFTTTLAVLVQGMEADGAFDGLMLGLIAAVGFILTSNATNYTFEDRSLRIYAINCGYPLVAYALIGILLAAWQ